MKITLCVYGNLKDVVGTRETAIEGPEGAMLKEIPALLRSHFGEELYHLLNNQQPFVGLRVLINGRDHFTLEGLDTMLVDGDRVTIFPPIAGG